LDDRYVINAAKTRLCGSYALGNVEEILSFFADAFTDLSEGQPTLAHIDAKTVLKARLEKLFRENAVELSPIIIEVKLADGMAVDYGWHVMTLRPRSGGPAETRRTRYTEIWEQDPARGWRIVVYIDNNDHDRVLIDDTLRALDGTSA
jgi:ketosteroid isomerase-like protein